MGTHQIVGSLIALALISATAAADPRFMRFGRERSQKIEARVNELFEQRSRDESPRQTDPLVASGTFTQVLDHFADATAAGSPPVTFAQRYFVNSRYADPANLAGSPVIYEICGEAECGTPGPGSLGTLAKVLKAHLVSLEHRYYGQSIPFASLTTDNLRYLSTDQALRDLAEFQTHAQANFGLRGKWIVAGGSYAGALSAFYRMQYPQLVVGALASSGPVDAKLDFEEYDHHVWQAMDPACRALVRARVDEVEARLADPATHDQVKALFGAQVIVDDVDFLYLVADNVAGMVQYGMKPALCAAATSLDTLAVEQIKVYRQFGAYPLGFTPQAGTELSADAHRNIGMRQWYYQSCKEYGFFQNAWHVAAESARSARINPAYHVGVCRRLFGIDPVETAQFNRDHADRLRDPRQGSRTLFTNGTDDPYSELSFVPGQIANPALDFYLIQGGAHCDDLRAPSARDSDSLKGARARFQSLVAEWLR